MKKVLITGITGQDGSYLTEFLLKKIILFTELSDLHQFSKLIGLIICILIQKLGKKIKITLWRSSRLKFNK